MDFDDKEIKNSTISKKKGTTGQINEDRIPAKDKSPDDLEIIE